MNRKGPWEGYSRLARCLLPAFLWAHIFIKRETSGYEAVTPKSGTEPIWYVTLHFRDWRGAVSPRYWNRAQITYMCERKLVRVLAYRTRLSGYSVLNIAQSLNPRSLAKRVVNLNWTKSALIIYKKVQFTCLLQIVLSQIKRGKSEHRWNFIP